MEHAIEKLDFFQIKMLEGKQGTLYIRDGKAYIYQGSDKYHLTEGSASEYIPRDIRTGNLHKPMDISKDTKVEGRFRMVHMPNGFYSLVFIDDVKKFPPILLNSGNTLTELEETNNA